MKHPIVGSYIGHQIFGKVNTMGFPNGEALVYLKDDERAMLAKALREWHENDTKVKGHITDDDEQHYFIEDLSRQLEWTDPDYGMLYNRGK